MSQINRNKDYYIFDVDGFFRDYKKNKRRLRDLEWEKTQAMSQGGMDYSKPKVSGGLPSSQVETAVERMSVLSTQIDDLREYFRKADKYLDLLDKDEKEIANVYFIQGRRNGAAISELSSKCYISERSVYRAIGGIRKKIREYNGKR